MLKHAGVIAEMTVDEKIRLCSGGGLWETKPFPGRGISSMFMCDGPHGLRKLTEADQKDGLGMNSSVASTCFPTAVTAASAWDAELMREMGGALGEEAVRENVNMILGPGVNMKRNPLCGRNFEYYSEDPFLSGKLAAAWISGVQARGVGTCLKHFAANNQENKRMAADSLVDERALREYYLPAFEIAVKEARPVSVMCAYNKINGTYCSNNAWLLDEVLRKDWSFDGAVVSDWGATNDRVEGFVAGMDLEMPSSRGYFDERVKKAVESGELDEALIDRSADRILTLLERTDLRRANLVPPGHTGGRRGARVSAAYGTPSPGPGGTDICHNILARVIAAAGAVLLKNDGEALPLAPGAEVTVIGALAMNPRFQGTGSSAVTPLFLYNLLDGLEAYTDNVTYIAGYRLADEPDRDLLREAAVAAGRAKTVILSLGLTEICESEGFDRENMSLPQNQLELLEAVQSANSNVILVLSGGSPIETPFLDEPGGIRAVLNMQLAGQAGGLACADLLFGAECPSGKLAETWPLRYEDAVSAQYYDNPARQADYRESVFAGYRYFDSAGKPVRFPFGYGLSYTSFAYSDLRAESLGGYGYKVRFTVTNTGGTAGADAAQLYVAPKTGGAYRPAQELKAFGKAYLSPGESAAMEMTLDARSFAVWDTKKKDWIVERGDYELRAGASSRDIRLRLTLTLDGEPAARSDCAEWYRRPSGAPSKADFVTVYGRYPDYIPPKKGAFDMSCSVMEMRESCLLARIIHRAIERSLARGIGGKADYGNAQFKMLMLLSADSPLAVLRLFSPDTVTDAFARFLLDAANGRFWTGLARFLRKKPDAGHDSRTN